MLLCKQNNRMDNYSNIDPHQPIFLIEEIQQMCAEMRKKNSKPHIHNYYSVYWITEGEAIHATQYVEYPIKAESVFFVPANLLHKMILNNDTKGYVILINNVFLDSKTINSHSVLKSPLFDNPEFNSYVKLTDVNSSRFTSILEMLLEENNSSLKYKDDTIASLLRVFLLSANRLFEEQNLLIESPVDEDKKQLIEFKKLIDSEFYENKDVSYYAKSMNMRPSCLNELSKKYTGITAGELIRNRIIDETKKLLYSTDWSSKEIAYHLGFNDPAYFSRFFKKYTNNTLTEFKNLIRKKYNESVV